MKSLYIKEQHCFQEQAEFIKRSLDDPSFLTEDILNQDRNKSYHARNLRSIPCRPSDIWQEGIIYEEHLDYKVEEGTVKGTGAPYLFILPIDTDDEDIYDAVRRKRNQIPEPLAPQSEGELWRRVIANINSVQNLIWIEFQKGNYEAALNLSNNLSSTLSGAYTLTRKSDVPEAVEFGDFLRSYAPFDYRGDTLWRTRDGKKIHTTQELYEGDFLQHKIKKP